VQGTLTLQHKRSKVEGESTLWLVTDASSVTIFLNVTDKVSVTNKRRSEESHYQRCFASLSIAVSRYAYDAAKRSRVRVCPEVGLWPD